MFYIQNLYGKIRCVEDNLGCKLDAETSRMVIYVSGTARGTLTLRDLHILRESFSFGGGLTIYTGAVVVVEVIFFSGCQATDSGSRFGGGAIYAKTGTLNLFDVSFSRNTVASI